MNKSFLQPLNFYDDKNWVKSFLGFKIEPFEKSLQTNEDFFVEASQKMALDLFHKAAIKVPAYKDFLKKHTINHAKIKTIADFSKIPLTDSKNYISKYSLEKRCWDGDLPKSDVVAVSSGTMGEPKFWPRGSYQEYEAAIIHELLYKCFFNIDRYKTLMIIGFPMGIYVSGIATTIPTWLISQKGYDITMLTVGGNKVEILKAVKAMQQDYEQVVLIGHPFFIKDVVETGRSEGIVWSKKRFHIMSCSEGFNEVWRRYLLKKIGGKPDITTIINTYGSSELLLVGSETPMSILIKFYLEHKKHTKDFFNHSGYYVNLFQYNPLMRYIESIQNELIFTSRSGIPLIRFNMHDAGEIIPFEKAKKFLNHTDVDWQNKISNWPIWKLPFVSLYGRSDKTLTFYAANIYPEHIHVGLNNNDLLKSITGKFVMKRDYSKNMDQLLEINVELRPGIEISKKLAKLIQKSIVKSLLKINMEYLYLAKTLKKDLTPKILLRSYQDEKYFKPGLKPKYII